MINKLKENHCWVYSLILPVYLISFFLLERMVTDNYWVSYIFIDDYIPFWEWAVIPYVLWYPYLLGIAIILLYKDTAGFKRYAIAFGMGFFIALVVCAIFPNGQELRQIEFKNNNIAVILIKAIYKADTNTNVLPSMHVIGVVVGWFSLFKIPGFKNKVIKILYIIFGLSVCASTVLIKQHSILDVFAAIPVCFIVYFFVYRKKSFVYKRFS